MVDSRNLKSSLVHKAGRCSTSQSTLRGSLQRTDSVVRHSAGIARTASGAQRGHLTLLTVGIQQIIGLPCTHMNISLLTVVEHWSSKPVGWGHIFHDSKVVFSPPALNAVISITSRFNYIFLQCRFPPPNTRQRITMAHASLQPTALWQAVSLSFI